MLDSVLCVIFSLIQIEFFGVLAYCMKKVFFYVQFIFAENIVALISSLHQQHNMFWDSHYDCIIYQFIYRDDLHKH